MNRGVRMYSSQVSVSTLSIPPRILRISSEGGEPGKTETRRRSCSRRNPSRASGKRPPARSLCSCYRSSWDFSKVAKLVPRASGGALPSSDCRDIGKSAAKAAEPRPALPARWISLSIALSLSGFLLAQVITSSRPGRNDPRVPSNQL